MKHQVSGRLFVCRKLLRLALPIVLLAALVSCFFPQGQAFWSGLLQKSGLTHFTSDLPADELHIHVIDVGKADAILIESPEAVVLVDTGTQDTANAVKRYLAARDVESLDAVWISHADNDHAGGLEEVLRFAAVNEIVNSSYSEIPGIQSGMKTAAAGETWKYGDMTFEVFAPIVDLESENDNSIVFRLRYGSFTMLFCGDIEAKAEEMLLKAETDLHADVLKVAHHGSNTSTSSEFIEAVDPQYSVISVAEDRNKLPRNAVLKRLNDAEIPYFRTDEHGSVVISTDGENIYITTEKTG